MKLLTRSQDTLEKAYARLPVSAPSAVTNAYLRLTVDTDFDGYANPPDPFAPRRIDPDRIESFTGRPYPPYHDKPSALGTVRAGDWDQREQPPITDEAYRERYELYRADRFSESTFFQSFQAHFQDDVPWQETPFVKRCLELAERSEPSWRSMTSKAALRDHCTAVDNLYERIKTNGYQSQRALGNPSVLSVTDEVVIDLGRDGKLLFVNGRHRLAIAKLLGIESIPVGVLVRHRDWMETRASLAQKTQLPAHPDLVDLRH